MRVSIVVAIGKTGQIGLENKLLWHHSEDLKNFKKLTLNSPIVMGRKTYESIGRPLPKRENWVLTRDSELSIDGVRCFHSFESILDEAHKQAVSELFIIGGGQLYKEALPLCDRLYVTHVDYTGPADTFFPEIPTNQFDIIEKRDLPGAPAAQFCIYQRKEIE